MLKDVGFKGGELGWNVECAENREGVYRGEMDVREGGGEGSEKGGTRALTKTTGLLTVPFREPRREHR